MDPYRLIKPPCDQFSRPQMTRSGVVSCGEMRPIDLPYKQTRSGLVHVNCADPHPSLLTPAGYDTSVYELVCHLLSTTGWQIVDRDSQAIKLKSVADPTSESLLKHAVFLP